jgi:sugar O-acyltransferase (sialic acid O-acetyltransferase NeuD family)
MRILSTNTPSTSTDERPTLMTTLLIGASPKTRLLLDCLAAERRLGEIAGIVDRDPSRQGQEFCGQPVLGDLESVLAERGDSPRTFCISLSERRFADRRGYWEQIEAVGCRMASIISRRTMVARSAEIAEGAILFPGATVMASARLGRAVTLWTTALVEHDCVLDDNVEISSRAALAGGVRIGSNSFVGINATILPHLTIGTHVLIGAGAVVTRDVPDHAVVAGNPARILREQPQ